MATSKIQKETNIIPLHLQSGASAYVTCEHGLIFLGRNHSNTSLNVSTIFMVDTSTTDPVKLVDNGNSQNVISVEYTSNYIWKITNNHSIAVYGNCIV